MNYASDFTWDRDFCKRFVVGAIVKSGQTKESISNEFSRAYFYEYSEKNDKPKVKTTFIIISACVIAAIVIIVVVIVTIILVRRNKSRDKYDNADSILEQ